MQGQLNLLHTYILIYKNAPTLEKKEKWKKRIFAELPSFHDPALHRQLVKEGLVPLDTEPTQSPVVQVRNGRNDFKIMTAVNMGLSRMQSASPPRPKKPEFQVEEFNAVLQEKLATLTPEAAVALETKGQLCFSEFEKMLAILVVKLLFFLN